MSGVLIYQPHCTSRGTGEVASHSDWETVAQAHANHLWHQLEVPAGSAWAVWRWLEEDRKHVDHWGNGGWKVRSPNNASMKVDEFTHVHLFAKSYWPLLPCLKAIDGQKVIAVRWVMPPCVICIYTPSTIGLFLAVKHNSQPSLDKLQIVFPNPNTGSLCCASQSVFGVIGGVAFACPAQIAHATGEQAIPFCAPDCSFEWRSQGTEDSVVSVQTGLSMVFITAKLFNFATLYICYLANSSPFPSLFVFCSLQPWCKNVVSFCMFVKLTERQSIALPGWCAWHTWQWWPVTLSMVLRQSTLNWSRPQSSRGSMRSGLRNFRTRRMAWRRGDG